MNRSLFVVLAVAVSMSSTTAEAQPSCSVIPSADAFIRINANTGAYQGSTRYPEGEALQVIVDKKNPFKYEYRIEVTARPLNEAIITEFLSSIPGFGLAGLLGDPVAPPPPPAAGPACPALNNEWTALSAEVTKAASLQATVQTRIGSSELYNAFFKRTDVESFAEAECKAVLTDAAALQKALPSVINLGTLPKDVEQLAQTSGAALKTFETGLTALQLKDSGAAMACVQNLGMDLVAARSLPTQVATITKAVQGLVATKPSFEAMQTVINGVLAHDDAFSEQRRPPTQEEPTGVRVLIARKNRRAQNAAEQQITSLEVQVGRSRFSMAAGFGFSGVPQRTVVRRSAQIDVPGTPATATAPAVPASTRVANVFAYQPDSDWALRPMVALNAHLTDFRARRVGDVALSFTSAAAIGAGDDELKVEYLFGPSLGLLQNRLVFTFGLFLGRPETLGGNFEIGKEVPSTLQDPIPVNTDWAAGFGWGVTYRIR